MRRLGVIEGKGQWEQKGTRKKKRPGQFSKGKENSVRGKPASAKRPADVVDMKKKGGKKGTQERTKGTAGRQRSPFVLQKRVRWPKAGELGGEKSRHREGSNGYRKKAQNINKKI